VLLNTAGGITGGDRFAIEGEAGPGSALTLTTQAAERIYRSSGGEGRVATRLSAGAGATLHWLPQETILFEGGRLLRSLDADIAVDARFLALETVVLGREAMGENVTAGFFEDCWRVRRGGRLVFADTLRLSGAIGEIAANPALLAGNRAAATLLYTGPDAEARLAPLRAALSGHSAASVREGCLVARLLAPSARALRAMLVPLVTLFRPLPAVWQS
jgi:urease accessory protein